MSRVRILHIVSVLNRGGVETLLMNLYRHIDREAFQFDFLCHKKNGIYENEIKSLGGRIYHVCDMPEVSCFKYRRSLENFFKEHGEYNIVHCHMSSRSGVILREARKSGVPFRIAHVHNSGNSGSIIKKIYKWYSGLKVVKYATSLFACSEAAGRWLYKDRIFDSGRVTVLKNSIDTGLFSYDPDKREDIRNLLGLKDSFVVGHVGNFIKCKNHEFLIETFYHVKSIRDNAVLLLAGGGNMLPYIRKKVEQMGLTDSVRFLGVREDVNCLMQAMDIFVFPSVVEGLGMVLIEAQTAGLKCIASDSVPEEVNITGRIDFLSLKLPAAVWAEKILAAACDRVNTVTKVVRSGYDAADTAKMLQEFYKGLGDFK